MRKAKVLIGVGIVAVVTYGGFEYFRPAPEVIVYGLTGGIEERIQPQKTVQDRIAAAYQSSQNVKGVYMPAAVANDQGKPATFLRDQIVDLLETTELNGVVIDVKETGGAEMTPHLKPFIEILKQKNVWVIARVAAFRDDSQVAARPEYYLKRPGGRIWRDNNGHAWMDPMSPGARAYIADFSKEVIDAGFDELQFDYIRFPSDGDTDNIVYPDYRPTTTPKYVALRDFFSYAHDTVKGYKPEIILSADLFGYAAIEPEDLGIGQRLADIGNHFDYISLMLYPSHFYSGFYVPFDSLRDLPAVSLPSRAESSRDTAPAHPGDVVLRSLYSASDVLAGVYRLAAASSSRALEQPIASNAKLRPWLQDFNLGVDTSRGIIYDAKAVRAEIDAAEKAGASGWLLWNASNVYTAAALKPK